MVSAAFTDALLFGLASSLHCAGMCGPLAACFLGDGKNSAVAPAASYQGARTGAYIAATTLLGSLGAVFGTGRLASPGGWLAIGFGAVLILSVLGAGRLVRTPSLSVGRIRGLWQWALRRPPAWRAAAVGSITPALPCGVAWALFAAAAASGSATAGAATGLGFAAGSAPLLFLAHTQWVHLRRLLGPKTLGHVQTLAMLSAAAILVWRGIGALQTGDATCCGGPP